MLFISFTSDKQKLLTLFRGRGKRDWAHKPFPPMRPCARYTHVACTLLSSIKMYRRRLQEAWRSINPPNFCSPKKSQHFPDNFAKIIIKETHPCLVQVSSADYDDNDAQRSTLLLWWGNLLIVTLRYVTVRKQSVYLTVAGNLNKRYVTIIYN